VCERVGIGRLVFGRQVHGAGRVHVGVAQARDGLGEQGSWAGTGDILVTRERGPAVAVLTADCVPVALADPSGLLAVVHAGWRGVAAGGPSVGPDHYEVGEEVLSAIANAPFGSVLAADRRAGGRPRLDLAETVVRILSAHGVRRFERAEECTACEEDRFFSHRRDGGSGRQALVAVRW
jgi:copper oxidase (laccase) domain-containing protein